jgi:hypothetical protein
MNGSGTSGKAIHRHLTIKNPPPPKEDAKGVFKSVETIAF